LASEQPAAASWILIGTLRTGAGHWSIHGLIDWCRESRLEIIALDSVEDVLFWNRISGGERGYLIWSCWGGDEPWSGSELCVTPWVGVGLRC
jgi:hypothetical protein